MFDTTLLNILCCPETKDKLMLASDSVVNALNSSIKAGTLKNVAGENVTEPITEALVTENGKRLYIIREGIPVLLADEAILL